MNYYTKAMNVEILLEKLQNTSNTLHKKIKRLEKSKGSQTLLETLKDTLKKTNKTILEKHEEANKFWRLYAVS